MMSLDVVIVNWNSGAQLMDCLKSLQASSVDSVFHLSRCIVVDNASNDDSAIGLEIIPLPLTIIRNRENMGFAFACNQGAHVGDSELILFLNPDVRLFPDSLIKALAFLNEPKNDSVGILGIQLVDSEGVIQRNAARFPTPRSIIYQMLGLDVLWPARFPPRIMTDWDHRESKAVDSVMGALFLVRRNLFEQLKGFDQIYFLYFEEVDFAFRARQAGWKSFYLTEAQAFHRGGGTTEQIGAKRLAYWFISRIQYVAKHFGPACAWWIIITSLTLEFWARLMVNIIKLDGRHLMETIQAYIIYVLSLPRLLRDGTVNRGHSHSA